MKKEEVIEKLQAMPDGIEVCIFDWKLNATDDGNEEGSSLGIYEDFQISIEGMGDTDGQMWCALGFDGGAYEAGEELKLFEAVIQKKVKGTKLTVYTLEDSEQDARVYFTGKFKNKEHYTVISVNEVELI